MNLFKKKTNWSNFFGLDDSNEEAYSFEEQQVEEPVFEEEVAHHVTEPSYENQITEDKAGNSSDLSSSNQYKNKKVVDLNAYQNTSDKSRQTENRRVHRKITVFEPRAYADCKGIAQALFRKEIVIVTFSAMEEQQARRVVDFITGTIFAIDGDIQRIGEEIFICTPASVDIDSSVAQSLISTHLTNY